MAPRGKGQPKLTVHLQSHHRPPRVWARAMPTWCRLLLCECWVSSGGFNQVVHRAIVPNTLMPVHPFLKYDTSWLSVIGSSSLPHCEHTCWHCCFDFHFHNGGGAGRMLTGQWTPAWFLCSACFYPPLTTFHSQCLPEVAPSFI